MGWEPLERLHVSLINTATALNTVPLINGEEDRQGEMERISQKKCRTSGGKFTRDKTGMRESLSSG